MERIENSPRFSHDQQSITLSLSPSSPLSPPSPLLSPPSPLPLPSPLPSLFPLSSLPYPSLIPQSFILFPTKQAKKEVEEEQRRSAKERADKGEEHKPKFFTSTLPSYLPSSSHLTLSLTFLISLSLCPLPPLPPLTSLPSPHLPPLTSPPSLSLSLSLLLSFFLHFSQWRRLAEQKCGEQIQTF